MRDEVLNMVKDSLIIDGKAFLNSKKVCSVCKKESEWYSKWYKGKWKGYVLCIDCQGNTHFKKVIK